MSDSQNKVASAHAQCLLMCPISEQLSRQNSNDLHILEKLGDITNPSSSYMIKKYQRSSADHNLKIKENIRTPATLLKTIIHIENNILILDKNKTNLQLEFENNNVNSSLKNSSASHHQQSINTFIKNKINVSSDVAVQNIDILQIYLFVWDRYRMIAKDFILQSPQESDPASLSIWIECYERMIRWHIIMSYRLHNCQEYIKNHHHQNLESLNNLMKTLHTVLYPAASATLTHPNNSHINNIVMPNDQNTTPAPDNSNNDVINTPTTTTQRQLISNLSHSHLVRHRSEFTSYMLLLHFNSTTASASSSSSCHLSEILKLSLYTDDNIVSHSTGPSSSSSSSSVQCQSPAAAADVPVLRLAIQLCVAIHRRDSYLFFKLIKYISTTISNNNKSPVKLLHKQKQKQKDEHEYEHVNDSYKVGCVYPLLLSLLLSSIHTMRLYTIECLYKSSLKNTELSYEYLMELLVIPTIIELLHFITHDCKMDYNRQNRTVVLTIVLSPTGTAGVTSSASSTAVVENEGNVTPSPSVPPFPASMTNNTVKLNVEKMLETPAGRDQLNQTVKNILQPSPSSKTKQEEEEFIYTNVVSLDEYIGGNSYSQICTCTCAGIQF